MAKILALPIGLPPKEAVEYFQRKGFRLSFSWMDMMREEHAKAFTVAKVMRADILEDIRRAVDRAIAGGTTLEQFRRELTPLLQAKGWWGRGMMTDPKDGATKDVQLGSPRRLATIYDTNLRTSLSAGRWEQIDRTKKRRPYLRYIHSGALNARHQHKAWHGLVLPIDHVFWKTHFPPNGWHCGCWAQQLSDRDLERYGYQVSPDPEVRYTVWRNPRTGEKRRVPVGVDPGFDYNPGVAGRAHYDELLASRAAAAPADLREALAS
ncbi:MAG: phage minor head protein [Gemmatimonadaceae bacterium]